LEPDEKTADRAPPTGAAAPLRPADDFRGDARKPGAPGASRGQEISHGRRRFGDSADLGIQAGQSRLSAIRRTWRTE